MHVELGNSNPSRPGAIGPAVCYIEVSPGLTYEVADAGVEMEIGVERLAAIETAADLSVELMRQILTGDPSITHIPAQEAALSVIAAWQQEGRGSPTWVWCDNDDFAVLLGHFFGCPIGRPDDVEASHFTRAGAPGVFPPVSSEEDA